MRKKKGETGERFCLNVGEIRREERHFEGWFRKAAVMDVSITELGRARAEVVRGLKKHLF